MSWFITADTEEFLAVAGEYLRAEPARNSVVLTVTENLRVAAAAQSPAAQPPAGGPGSRPGRAVVRLAAARRSRPRKPGSGRGRWSRWGRWGRVHAHAGVPRPALLPHKRAGRRHTCP